MDSSLTAEIMRVKNRKEWLQTSSHSQVFRIQAAYSRVWEVQITPNKTW